MPSVSSSPTPVRVLLVCEYPTLNGGERSLLALVPALAARGFIFQALAPAEGALARAFAAVGVDVLPLETHDRADTRLAQQQIRETIATVVRQARPELIHANSLSAGRLVGPVAAALATPSLSHLRDIVGLSHQAIDDMNCHTRLLAVSRATRDFHLQQGVAADRTFVAYNGIDIKRFCPSAPTGWLHDAMQLPADAVLIGDVGQIVLRKGHDVLLSAVEALAPRLPHLHCVIVGDRFSQKDEARAFEEQLHTRAAAGPAAGRIHFVGFREDVAALLPELTLLVHPARQEPFGRVLLEAAATGVPIVATDVGGTREMLGEGGGMLVAPDDSQAMAAAIDRLLGAAELRHSQVGAARARVESLFTVPQAAATLEGHYREVLSLHCRATAGVASQSPSR